MTTSSDIQKIYIGYFGRAGDPGGLNYWVGRADGGASLDQIANTFAVLPEAQALYTWLAAPNLDVGVAEFVTQVYNNLFERDPEAGGLKFWTEYLVKNGVAAAGTFIETVIKAAANTVGGAQDKTTLDNKAVVGSYYTTEFLRRGATWDNGDLPQAREVVGNVTSDPATVTAGKEQADQFITDDLKPPAPTPKTIYLTTGIDNLKIGALDTVIGDTATFNQADTITGSSGTVNLSLTDVTASGTLHNLDLVVVNPNGNVIINAENWEDIDQLNVVEIDTGKNFTINEVQGSIPLVYFNDAKVGSTATVNYDGQDLLANNEVANLAVKEFKGKLVLTVDDGNTTTTTKTINLDVRDTKNFESTLEDLVGVGTETLNIKGGEAGINFKITAPLDATIKTLDASALKSNASLNVSESVKTIEQTIKLGTGNDTLIVGDTLFSDTITGGAGNDRVIAVFTDQDTRTPTMNGVETLEGTFNSTVTFDGTLVDDLKTIDLNASAGRADFNNMDSTLATLNVLGNLTQGVEVDYDGKAFANLTVNIGGKTGDVANPAAAAIGNAGNDWGIEVINADVLALNNNSTANVTIQNGIRVDESFSGRFTTDVTITNNSIFDLTINNTNTFRTVIDDGNTVERLTIRTTNTGDIFARGFAGFDDLMDRAGNLQRYTIDAATASTIIVGDVGDEVAAVDLEKISITAGVAAFVGVGSIDAEDGGQAATVDTIDVLAKTSSTIVLDDFTWLDAASVNKMTVSIAEEALVLGDNNADFPSLIGMELNAQANGSLLKVSGLGNITGFEFIDDGFATVDSTGLVTDGIRIAYLNPAGATGFKFLGGAGSDTVLATDGADTLSGGGGNDSLEARGGNDSVDGGAGNDSITGDGGRDTIDGNTGNDTIVGDTAADLLTGGAGNDTFFFSMTQGVFDTGISTSPTFKQDVITDFTPGTDLIQIDVAGNFGAGYTMAKVESLIGVANVLGGGPIRIVLERGNYNANGTFGVSATGADLQLLVKEDGGAFNPLNVVNVGGFFGEANVHEIGLLGAGSQFGSFNTTDIVFV